ncbi:hypothetical protein GGR57DRAFT_40112 [Xylariaceae sp. FL1272]|nr:hypothetical protein GGR57DRAFT_40112 [Xylariaceae sp. FL1272]
MSTRKMAKPQSWFMYLPTEVREIIYQYALIDKPLLYRRHQACCHCSQKKPGRLEEPPFVDARSSPFCRTPAQLVTCSCSKRQSLALMSTCREVYGEASPIFWKNNTFSWSSTDAFVQDISNSMPMCRYNIQNVCIYHEQGKTGAQYPSIAPRRRLPWRNNDRPRPSVKTLPPSYATLWEALKMCRSLSSLDLPFEVVRWSQGHFHSFELAQPNIKCIGVIVVRCKPVSGGKNTTSKSIYYSSQQECVWVIGRVPLHLAHFHIPFLPDQMMHEYVRQYTTNYLALWERKVDSLLANESTAHDAECSFERLSDQNNLVMLRLRHKKCYSVEFLGLRNSAETLERNRTERRIANSMFSEGLIRHNPFVDPMVRYNKNQWDQDRYTGKEKTRRSIRGKPLKPRAS